MTRTAYIFIPGIHHNPSWPDGWTDRAVEWLHDAGADGETAEKFEYYASFALRRFGQQRRAEALAALAAKRSHRRLVITAHSNGNDIAERAFKFGMRCDVFNMVAPASEKDFWKNGLNDALRHGRIGRVNLWISGQDTPMKLARWSKWLLGWTGLGYGTLGIDGPQRIAPEVKARVREVRKPDWQHGTYWEPEFFEPFLRELYDLSQ